jgi:hypothetical protein
MSHILQVKLEGFADGLFVIQPAYSEEEFAQLVKARLPAEFIVPYSKVYRDLKDSRSGSLYCNGKSPWVIVVFGSSPRLIRRYALHEIVHLAEHIMPMDGRQFMFIEQAYMAVKIPMEDSYDFGENRSD